MNQETEINVISSDNSSVPIMGRCRLIPVPGTNYALGEITVRGRRLIKESVNVTASINGDKALTKVRVKQKDEKGVNIDIQLREEDLGTFRALWNEREGKPNQLLISTKHNSIGRYLDRDPETKEWVGDETLHFRVLLGEIVTESVCRKALSLESKARSWEFKFADYKDDNQIADTVFFELQKRIRSFATIAHTIMVEI